MQHRIQYFNQFIEFIWFGYKTTKAMLLIIGHHRIISIAAGYYRFDLQINLAEHRYRFHAAHAAGHR